MSISGILFFVGRAARFSFAVCLMYAACRAVWLKMKKRRFDFRRELVRLVFVSYFAALVEIIALRGGSGSVRIVRAVPLMTTFGEIKHGAWPFVYHLVGNMIWFAPLGMFLGKKGPLRALLVGAGVSLVLEALQWLLATGVTDVDDVLLNALGTWIGYFFSKACAKWRRSGV